MLDRRRQLVTFGTEIQKMSFSKRQAYRLPSFALLVFKGGTVRVTSAGISFALAIFLARWLGPEAFGTYSFSFALLGFAILIAQLGFADLTVREVARLLESGRSQVLGRYLLFSRRFILGFSLVVSLLVLGVVLALWSGDPRSTVIAAGLPLPIFYALVAHHQAILRGSGYIILGLLAAQLFRPATFFCLVLIAAAAGAAPTPSLVMMLHSIAAGVILVVVVCIMRRLLRAPQPGRVARIRTRLWILSAFTLSGVAVVRLINQKFDIIAIGLLTDQLSVGYYTVAAQLSLAASLMLQLTSSLVAPKISQLSSAGDVKRIEAICRQSCIYSFTSAIAVFVIVAVWGEQLISILFGPEYVSAAHVALILVGGQVVYAFFGPVGIVLNMRGQEKITLLATFVASLLNVALNFALIPRFGYEAAAFATVSAIVLWNVTLWSWAWRLWGINSSALPLPRARIS